MAELVHYGNLFVANHRRRSAGRPATGPAATRQRSRAAISSIERDGPRVPLHAAGRDCVRGNFCDRDGPVRIVRHPHDIQIDRHRPSRKGSGKRGRAGDIQRNSVAPARPDRTIGRFVKLTLLLQRPSQQRPLHRPHILPAELKQIPLSYRDQSHTMSELYVLTFSPPLVHKEDRMMPSQDDTMPWRSLSRTMLREF